MLFRVTRAVFESQLESLLESALAVPPRSATLKFTRRYGVVVMSSFFASPPVARVVAAWMSFCLLAWLRMHLVMGPRGELAESAAGS